MRKSKQHKVRKQRNSSRDLILKDKYGIGFGEYRKMFNEQEGKCKLCGFESKFDFMSHTSKIDLHVDHDHVTGFVRGLLCMRCNTGLGMLKDDINILVKAIEYLRTPVVGKVQRQKNSNISTVKQVKVIKGNKSNVKL